MQVYTRFRLDYHSPVVCPMDRELLVTRRSIFSVQKMVGSNCLRLLINPGMQNYGFKNVKVGNVLAANKEIEKVLFPNIPSS